MKVRIMLTVDVDVDKWRLEYGPNRSVFDDVISYFATEAQSTAAVQSGIVSVEVS